MYRVLKARVEELGLLDEFAKTGKFTFFMPVTQALTVSKVPLNDAFYYRILNRFLLLSEQEKILVNRVLITHISHFNVYQSAPLLMGLFCFLH